MVNYETIERRLKDFDFEISSREMYVDAYQRYGKADKQLVLLKDEIRCLQQQKEKLLMEAGGAETLKIKLEILNDGERPMSDKAYRNLRKLNAWDDKLFMLAVVKRHPDLLKLMTISDELPKLDLQLARKACENAREQEIPLLDLVIIKFQDQIPDLRAFVRKVVKRNPWSLNYIPEDLVGLDVIISAVKKQPKLLLKEGFFWAKNPEVAKAALSVNGYNLRYAEGWQDDKEMARYALNGNVAAFIFFSDRLKDDPECAMEAVLMHGSCLKYVSERLRDNKQVVLAAVRQFGAAYQYASERLKNDREVIHASLPAGKKHMPLHLLAELPQLSLDQK